MERRRRPRPAVALLLAFAVGLAAAAGAALFIRSGVYNVAADDPHLPATHALFQQIRDASVRARAAQLDVPPDLDDPARIRQGAGNYEAMCMQCHLAPGMAPTELARGLYPAPPDLTRRTVEAAEAFWVVKHGIKASGMPAWGGSMDDAYIWNLVAFVRQLPRLDAAGYRAQVAASGGHSHGGGEAMPHAGAPAAAGAHPHLPQTPPHHDSPAPAHVDAPGAPPHTH